jgi:hypothetical protein
MIFDFETRSVGLELGNTVHLLFPWCRLRLGPLGTSATNWPTVSVPDDMMLNVEQSVE